MYDRALRNATRPEIPGAFELFTERHSPQVHRVAVERLRERNVRLPTFAELARPVAEIGAKLRHIDPDAADGANLWRVHWFNTGDRRNIESIPGYLLLTPELTGVEAHIAVALGCRFPMIRAHKVLAAYGCVVPRLVTGDFDPTTQRAVWPSTGNYCRGGVAISRILGCRGVAVLPEGMSRERFAWLEAWTETAEDVVRTPGSESNVKEIYDRCHTLATDPRNVILNQFSEFANYLVHYQCTGSAMADIFDDLAGDRPNLQLGAFVSATGSAGTLAAGDYLKERYGCAIAAAEALECPTLLHGGYGEHNIQGIGDKHVPLIHNVMNTDYVVAVSDRATDALSIVFNSEPGRQYLRARRGVEPELVDALDGLGFSSIANVLAAIKIAKHLRAGPDTVFLTVATDGAELYESERRTFMKRHYGAGFDAVHAAEIYAQHMLGQGTDNLLELTRADRERIFNLGYYTWVEQQGVSVDAFESRRKQSFWIGLRRVLPRWDELISETNEQTGVPDVG